jgi:hypothetical protein
MKTLRNSSIIAVAIVALALLVASPMAFAGSVTWTSNTIPATTSVGPSMGTLTVNKFDNSPTGTYAGDTLNDMIITLYGNGSVIFNYELFNPNSLTGGSLTINSITSTTKLTAAGAVAPVTLTLTGTYTPGSMITDTTVGTEYFTPSTPLPLGNISSGTLTDVTDLANFSGSGVASLLLSGTAPVSYDGNCTNGYVCALGGATLAGAGVTVQYDYSSPGPGPVPEPGTLGLLGTGLLGLAGMLRNRFSKSS